VPVINFREQIHGVGIPGCRGPAPARHRPECTEWRAGDRLASWSRAARVLDTPHVSGSSNHYGDSGAKCSFHGFARGRRWSCQSVRGEDEAGFAGCIPV
jgi:hypothetical protein